MSVTASSSLPVTVFGFPAMPQLHGDGTGRGGMVAVIILTRIPASPALGHRGAGFGAWRIDQSDEAEQHQPLSQRPRALFPCFVRSDRRASASTRWPSCASCSMAPVQCAASIDRASRSVAAKAHIARMRSGAPFT